MMGVPPPSFSEKTKPGTVSGPGFVLDAIPELKVLYGPTVTVSSYIILNAGIIFYTGFNGLPLQKRQQRLRIYFSIALPRPNPAPIFRRPRTPHPRNLLWYRSVAQPG